MKGALPELLLRVLGHRGFVARWALPQLRARPDLGDVLLRSDTGQLLPRNLYAQDWDV